MLIEYNYPVNVLSISIHGVKHKTFIKTNTEHYHRGVDICSWHWEQSFDLLCCLTMLTVLQILCGVQLCLTYKTGFLSVTWYLYWRGSNHQFLFMPRNQQSILIYLIISPLLLQSRSTIVFCPFIYVGNPLRPFWYHLMIPFSCEYFHCSVFLFLSWLFSRRKTN